MKASLQVLFFFIFLVSGGPKSSAQSVLQKHRVTISNESYLVYFTLKSDSTLPHGKYLLYHNNALFVEGTLAHGKREGVWKKYYPNGTLSIQAHYTNNLADSTWQYFYNNGALKAELHFNKNQLSGVAKAYYASGLPSAQIDFINDTSYKSVNFYYPNGEVALHYESTVQDDDLYELYSKYYDNQLLFWYAQYKNKKLHGKTEQYHLSSLPWQSFEYQNGKLVHAHEGQSADGVHQKKGTLNNGTGSLLLYHENGLKYADLNYENGLLNDSAKYYYYGRPYTIGFYKNNQPKGTWKYYSLLGKHLFTANYGQNDSLTFTQHLGMNQERIEGSFYQQKRWGKWSYYNVYGELVELANFKENFLHGYYKYGRLTIPNTVGLYHFGDKIGEWKSYNSSGKLVHEERYLKQIEFNSEAFKAPHQFIVQYAPFALNETRLSSTSVSIGTAQPADFLDFEYTNTHWFLPKIPFADLAELPKNYNFLHSPIFQPIQQETSFNYSLKINWPHFSGGRESELVYYATNQLMPTSNNNKELYNGFNLVQINIDCFGFIESAELIKTTNAALAQETLKLVNKMPAWEPLFLNNLPLPSAVVKRIEFFTLNESSEESN